MLTCNVRRHILIDIVKTFTTNKRGHETMTSTTKRRVYQVRTIDGNFRFFADDMENANDHIWSMNSHPEFKSLSKVKFVGWAHERDNLDEMFVSV